MKRKIANYIDANAENEVLYNIDPDSQNVIQMDTDEQMQGYGET